MNPYSRLPDTAFWRRSVAGKPAAEIDPVDEPPFAIGPSDAIATVDSCFAQHLSNELRSSGFNYLIVETSSDADAENYGTYPARFGNIYTVRQLLQLFDRAYGVFAPADECWTRADGRLVDPFRPMIQSVGFATAAELVADRRRHLAAVREMFERCSVLVFTLGLSEAWTSRDDGAVFPLAPGVVSAQPADGYVFRNFSVAEMTDDLRRFIGKLRVVSPLARVILTVSPVPLKATYEPRHVLVSNAYSKAALRVVAEEISKSLRDVAYFPSYEMITSGGHEFYEDDRRTVTAQGVDHVMRAFRRHFLDRTPAETNSDPRHATGSYVESARLSAADAARLKELTKIVCDEEALDPQ